MRSESQRLHRLMARRNLCPVHCVKLQCGCTHQWRWTGSRQEWDEYRGMLARVDHLYAPLFVHGTCHTCAYDKYCDSCAKDHMTPAPIPFSEPEMARLLTLAALLVRQEPDHAV